MTSKNGVTTYHAREREWNAVHVGARAAMVAEERETRPANLDHEGALFDRPPLQHASEEEEEGGEEHEAFVDTPTSGRRRARSSILARMTSSVRDLQQRLGGGGGQSRSSFIKRSHTK